MIEKILTRDFATAFAQSVSENGLRVALQPLLSNIRTRKKVWRAPTMRRACQTAVLAVLVTQFSFVHATVKLPLGRDGLPSLASVVDEVAASVVNIAVSSTVSIQNNPLYQDPFFRRFFDLPEIRPRQQASAGSGVIIDADKGYVITNHHVIDNADEIKVTLKDRRTFDARLIGSDAGTDIALLQIEADNLTAAEFGNSDELKVGDFVIAIGNPFGIGQTVTSGIISALGRSGLNIEGYEDFIQTDASINPGNSGGALLTWDGQLIGINTAIIGPAGGNVGIGFAVPANMARSVLDQLLEYGEVRRGRLGVIIQDITSDLAEAFGSDVQRGALVSEVVPDSAAYEAGIQAGDIITQVNETLIEDSSDLRNAVGLMAVGSELRIKLIRDGQEKILSAKIGEDEEVVTSGEGQTAKKLAGAIFRDIEPGHPRYGEIEGVVVVDIERNGPAWQVGLRRNDIVTEVDRQPVRSVKQMARLLKKASGATALRVVRGNTAIYLVVR